MNVLGCMYNSGVACLMPLCSNRTNEMQNVVAFLWKTSVAVYRYYCLVVYLIAPFFSVINAYCAGKPPYTVLLPCDVATHLCNLTFLLAATAVHGLR